jgi:HD-like signal output (HDOD) protein
MMTATNVGLAKLKTLFRNIGMLPELPATVRELVLEITDPAANTDRLTWLLVSDPQLLNNFRRLCLAHQVEPGRQGNVWIKSAVYLLGVNAVRRFVIALLLQRSISTEVPGCFFDPQESIGKTLRFGLMSECVFASPDSLCVSDSPEPGAFFISEVLHEIPRVLLAHQAPGVYNRVCINAELNQISFEEAFERLFDSKLLKLGEAAIQSWGLMGAIGSSLIMESAEEMLGRMTSAA